MNGHFDYRKFAILYVDDEEKSLKMFAQAFESIFRIFTAPSAAEGLAVLEEHQDEIGLVMSDQRMPGEKGAQFLERVRRTCPGTIRVLATAYADIEAAITAVNNGAIYHYVTKPWEMAELEQILRRGLEFFMVQQERDQLLREKLSSLHNMMIADRVIGLGIMAAGLSHHIRNSLVAVRTFLDLAPAKLEQEHVDLKQLQSPAYWRGFYEQVQGQVSRITGILSDLGLATDQPPSEFADSVRLETVLGEAVEKTQGRLRQKKVELETRLAPDLPEVRGDKAKLCRLFELLLQDEASSLPEGSQVTVAARLLPAGFEQEAALQIQVKDNGPGMSTEDLRSIFDPFFTRKDNPQELGLNLMACYFIVHHHGGRIEVKSREKLGTTFTIWLPLEPSRQALPLPEKEFLSKALLNDELWHKLLAGQDPEK